MSFTGKLGSSDSLLGNVILGFTGASEDSGTPTQDIFASDFGFGSDTGISSGNASYQTDEYATSIDVGIVGVIATDSASLSNETLSLVVLITESSTAIDTITSTAILSGSDRATTTDVAIPGPQAVDFAFSSESASFTDVTPFCDSTSGTIEAPLQRLGPEYFLPHWVTANSNRTGLLFALCQWGAENELQFRDQTIRATTGKYLNATRVREPLYEWTINFVPPADREMTMTCQSTNTSGNVLRTVRRATSLFDFETTVDPVWYQDSIQRKVRLRNLFMRTIQRYSSGTVYTICGTGAAGYLGVVPDTGYFYRKSPLNNWEWISPESDRFGYQSVNLPGSGTWLIAYGSSADLASLKASGTVTASWAGGDTRQLRIQFTPFSNLFDGYGFLLGIPRIQIPFESNFSYKARMLALVLSPPDTTLTGVLRGIGARFNLVRRVVWNGVSTLTLDAGGTQNITTVTVPNIDKYSDITETLYATSGSTVFYTELKDWRDRSIIFVNGIPVNNYAVSGNRVTFSQPVTGVVQAVYSVATYTLTTNSAGYINTVVPGQGIVSGSYNVLYTVGINAHVVDQPDYQRISLLTPNGLPNRLFLEIAARLTENNPTTFGRSRWGTNATWLDRTDKAPATSRLPIPFDNNASNG